MRNIFVLSLAVLLSPTTMSACEKAPDDPVTASSGENETSERGDAASPADKPPGSSQTTDAVAWKSLDEEAMDDRQRAQMKTALTARRELGSTLVQALGASISEKGFAESIEFCRGAAPDVTEKMAKKHGVEMGRTSHKLRNPKNAPPEWAEDAVAEGTADELFFAGPENQLGALSPIPTGDLCVNCHGPADKLADGVPQALKVAYPKDRATGFSPGDVRGWFWVEVPPS